MGIKSIERRQNDGGRGKKQKRSAKKQNIQLKNEKLNVRIHNNDVWIKQLLERQMMKFDIF